MWTSRLSSTFTGGFWGGRRSGRRGLAVYLHNLSPSGQHSTSFQRYYGVGGMWGVGDALLGDIFAISKSDWTRLAWE